MSFDLGFRVRVNAIEPAAIENEMLKECFVGTHGLYDQLMRRHPQQRIGRPDEVAFLALAMAWDGMRFLHGACVGLDGGISWLLHDPE